MAATVSDRFSELMLQVAGTASACRVPLDAEMRNVAAPSYWSPFGDVTLLRIANTTYLRESAWVQWMCPKRPEISSANQVSASYPAGLF